MLRIDKYENLDRRKLMDLYQEGNRENCLYFHPDKAIEDSISEIEDNFMNYLKEFYSKPGNWYYILEKDGTWISALRLSHVEGNIFYIEAVETHPEYRKKGFAAELLTELISEMKKQKSSFRLCDCVSHKNTASLALHKKCGFQIVSEAGYDYLRGETDKGCYGLQYEWKS